MEEQQNTIRIPEGRCNLCCRTFSKEEMTEHLETCREENAPKPRGRAKPRQGKVFHLVVEGVGLPQYWMHLDAPADATLRELDGLLREVWLECCGHMSAFTIGKKRYSVLPTEELEEEGMDIALGEVLRPQMEFCHEYDFGTTTGLLLRVVAEREGLITWKSILFLAMNVAPEIKCSSCGERATQVCCLCIGEGEEWLCDECAPRHECGEDMLLPVLNSPRTGMCAYGT